jgi:transposase
MKTKAMVDQIRALIDAIENYDDQIKQVFHQHPDRFIFDSFPGAGQALAPRLLAAFRANRDQLQSAGQIQMLAGIAPVTESSGKSRRVHSPHGLLEVSAPKFPRILRAVHPVARLGERLLSHLA